MGNNFCQEIKNDDNNKFTCTKIESKKYQDINSIIAILLTRLNVNELNDELNDELNNELNVNELNDELNVNELNDELFKEWFKKNIIKDTNEINLFVKTFYESKKVSINIFCFYSNDIKIFRLERNLENKIKLKGLDIKNLNLPFSTSKIKYSKEVLSKLLKVDNADMEIIFNMND